MNALTTIKNFVKRDEGQTLSEYALILILIAVVAIVAVTFLGGQITAVLNQIANAL
ncbi:Flp family type IVb pilin [candidate division KSB1 bacterium]|nr:Flp family type IVb pilin [candidate division KSB1 bacterium]